MLQLTVSSSLKSLMDISTNFRNLHADVKSYRTVVPGVGSSRRYSRMLRPLVEVCWGVMGLSLRRNGSNHGN